MKEGFVDRVFNLLDLARFTDARGRAGICSLARKLEVLRLEVFSVDEGRRVTIEQLPLQTNSIKVVRAPFSSSGFANTIVNKMREWNKNLR